MVVDEKALQSLKKEIGELKARLRESEGKLIEKEAYLRKILKEKDQYASELGAIKAERVGMDAELKEMKAQLASAGESFSAQINSEKGLLNDKLLSLEKLLKEKEGVASKAMQEHGTLEQRISDLEQENIHLQKMLEESQKKVLDTQDEVTWKIYAMRQPLEDKISSLEGTIKNNEAVLQETTQNFARVDTQLKTEHEQKQKIETELFKVKKELADAKTLVANRMQEVRGPLEDKIRSLEHQLAQSNTAVAQKESAVEEASVREGALRKDLESFASDNAALNEKIGSLQEQIQMMEDDLPLKISAATKSLEDELSVYESRLQETVTMVKERQVLLKDVLTKNDALTNELNTLKNEFNTATGEKEGAVRELSSVNQQLYDMEKVLGQEIDALKRQREENAGQIAALTQTRDDLNGEVMALREEKARLGMEFTTLEGDLADTKAIIPQKIQEARKPLEDQIRSFEALLKESKNDLSGRVAHSEKLSVQIDELGKKLLTEQDAGKRLREDLANTKSELDRTKALIPKEVAAVRAPLEERIAVLEKVIQQRDGMIADVSKQRQQLESSLNAVTTKKDSLDNELSAAQDQLRETREVLGQEIDALKKRSAQDTDQIAALTQARDKLSGDLAVLRDEKEGLEKELTRAESDLEKMEALIPQEVAAVRGPLEGKVLELEKMVQGKEAEVGQLSSRLEQTMKDLSQEQRVNAELEEKVSRLNSDLADTKAMIPQKIQEVSQPLEDQLRLYEEQLKASKGDLNDRSAHIEKLNTQINELNQKLLAQQATGKELEGELASTRGELERALASIPEEVAAVRTPLEDKITELAKSVKAKEEAIVLLNGRLDQTTQELLREQGTRKGLEDQLAKIMNELVQTKTLIPGQIDAVRQPLEERIRSYEAQLKTGKEDLSVRESSILSLKQQVDTLRSQLSAEQASRKKAEAGLTLSQTDLEKIKALMPAEVAAVRVPLENKVKDLESTVAAKEAEVGLLKERLDQVGKELAKEQEAKTVLDDKLVKLDEDLTKAKASVPQQILAAKTPLEARVIALEGMIQERDEVIASMKQQKDGADGNFKKLGDEKESLTIELASLKAQLGETKSSLGQELAGLKQKGVDDAGQIAALLKANEHLNSKLTSLQDENKALEEVLMRAKIDMEKTQAMIPEKVASVREVLEGNIASLETMLAQKNDLLLAATNNVNNLQAKLDEVNNRNFSLESELADVSDRLKKSEISISQNMDALRRPMEKEIIELEAKLKSAEAQVQESAPRLNALLKERDTFKVALDDSQVKNQTLAGELVKLQRMYEGAQSSLGGQLQGYERTIKEKDAAIASLTIARDKLKDDFSAAENARARLGDELAMVQGRLEETKTQIPEKLLVVQKPLEEKVSLYERQLVDVNAELREKERFVRDLTQRLDNLTKELVDTQREKHGLKESLTRMEAEMQANVNLLTRDLSDEKVSLVAEISSLKKALNEKTALVSDSAWQRDSLRNELSALNEKKIALEKEAAILKDQLKNSEMSISQSMDTLRRPLEKEIIDLEAQIKAAGAKLKDKDALIAQAMDKQKVLAQELDALAREKNLAERELSTIRLQLQSADTAVLPRIEEAKRPLEEKVAVLTAELHNVDNVIDQRVQENQILYEQRLKAIEQKLKDSESGLREKDIIIKELLQRKTETERELARVQEEKASQQAILEELNAKIDHSREDFTTKIKDAESRSKVFKQDITDRTVDLIEIRNELRSAMDLIRSSE